MGGGSTQSLAFSAYNGNWELGLGFRVLGWLWGLREKSDFKACVLNLVLSDFTAPVFSPEL